MAIEGFVPSAEFQKFEQINGEDTFLRINLLYIAFELSELYSEDINQKGEFDELCEDILEMYLDDQFDGFNVIDIAEGASFIITDSNYSVSEYVRTYKRNRDKICEELLYYLNKQRALAVENGEA